MLDGKKKYVMNKFGKDCCFIGQDKAGTNHFLEAATWNCGWYLVRFKVSKGNN